MTAIALSLMGRFAVAGEAAPPPVRGLIPQAVLARLALAEGEALSAEQLIADLWAAPPDEVLSSLRAHLSRLRSRGWGQWLSGGRAGYRLDPDGVEVDVVRFERLLGAAGDVPASVEQLDAAERLWRPHPLAWAQEFPFADAVGRRLERLHRAAALRLATLRLDAGDAAAAADGLGAVVDDDPADGAAVVVLGRALARTGRAEAALAAVAAHTAAAGARGRDADDAVLALGEAIGRRDPEVFGEPAPVPRHIERVGVPHPSTRFIGRADQLEAIRRGRGTSRLITVTGAAGVGKTRLAVETARRGDSGDDDIQWLVDLTAAGADDVLHLVAATVGAVDSTVASIEAVVGGRRGLLILDNAEHVLGAVAMACAQLLGACAGLSILVTSRETLRMSGERVVAVPPLVGDQLAEAVEMFLERAGDASGVRGWEPEQLALIERMCRALDGLPLAIELAASRLDVLSVDELASSIETRPDAAARPAVGGRHESIDAAIDWSIRLTTADERTLLGQLAEFAGPFTLDMVAGICVVDGADPKELTVSLARKSLVHTIAGVGGRRFRLLESVRQFVRRELRVDDADAWSARHAAWFRQAAIDAGQAFVGPDARRMQQRMTELRPDLDQALGWALRTGDRSTAVVILGRLGRFWSRRGAGSDVLELIGQALDLPGDAAPDDEADLLYAASYISAVTLRTPDVVRWNVRHYESAQRADDPLHPMRASSMMAHFAAAGGDIDRMEQLLADAERHREALGDRAPWAVADYLTVRGSALRVAGRPASALDALGEAYRLAGDVDYGFARAASCLVSGRTLTGVGRNRDAMGVLRTGMLRFLEMDDPSSALDAVDSFAAALASAGRMAEAARLFGAVDALGARFGYRGNAVETDLRPRAIARARAGLPEAVWDEAYALGGTWSMQQVAESLTP